MPIVVGVAVAVFSADGVPIPIAETTLNAPTVVDPPAMIDGVVTEVELVVIGVIRAVPLNRG